MQTDQAIASLIKHELRWDPRLSARPIHVCHDKGAVVVTARVPSVIEKWSIDQALEIVAREERVVNHVTVALPSNATRLDNDVRALIVAALKLDVRVEKETLHVIVSNAWVLLEGNVDRPAQREAAAQCVRSITGVRGLTNRIAVRP